MAHSECHVAAHGEAYAYFNFEEQHAATEHSDKSATASSLDAVMAATERQQEPAAGTSSALDAPFSLTTALPAQLPQIVSSSASAFPQLLQSTVPESGITIIALPSLPDLLALPADEIPLRRFPFDCVIDMNDTSTWPIVYKGREYAGMASRHPIFIPHPAFLVINPIWTQCSCVYGCFLCVYDGATLCAGCLPPHIQTYCDCEPGCCGIPLDSSGSSESSGSESTTTGGATTESCC